MLNKFITSSPLTRMLAVILVGYLARKGLIAAEDVNQSVEDTVLVIEFLSIVVALSIWQWKAHHPQKHVVMEELPATPRQQHYFSQSKERLQGLVTRVRSAVFVPKEEIQPIDLTPEQ